MNYKSTIKRSLINLVLFGGITTCFALVFVLQSKIFVFDSVSQVSVDTSPTPFPLSVNPETETIYDNSTVVNNFYLETLALSPQSNDRWWNQVAATLSTRDWYQNLASAVSRIVVIWPGERKEEIVKHLSGVLRWDNDQRETFLRLIDSAEPVLKDGKYFPGQYVTHRGASPEDMFTLINSKFNQEIVSRYSPEIANIIPLEKTLIIASLIEREASDFTNMREVSGVIWNRLFIDMPLQLDATLQYARGSKTYEPKWWPTPVPRDKYIDSPFNTSQHSGLPPSPIANPSAEAVLAALNPTQTDCLYYFHRNNGEYHCSVTYKEHVDKLRSFYGRGS